MKVSSLLWMPVKLLVNTCLFISIAAFTCALQTYLLHGLPLRITPLSVLVFFATLFVYNWQRILSNRKRLPYAAPGMHQWIKANNWWPGLAMAGSIFGMSLCAWQLSGQVQIVLALLGIICAAYALPIPLGKNLRLRLRDLGVFKPFVLGVVWGFATALLPLMDMGVSLLSREMIFIVTKRVLFISAICIPFDIKDMEFDRHTMHYPTIPLLVGERNSRYIAFLVMVLFEVLVILHNGLSPAGTGLSISFVLTSLIILYPNPRGSEYYYTFGIDSTIILQFLLVWLMLVCDHR